MTRKKFTLKKKIQKIRIILKSLGMTSKWGRQSQISLKENCVVSFNLRIMQILFASFSQSQQIHYCQKLPRPKDKSGVKTTEEYHRQIRNECEDFVPTNLTTVDKIF